MQKRCVAIATALILLGVGLLAQRHEADVAHAKEHSGRVVHAQGVADHHHTDKAAHLHGREVHEHAGDCSLLAMLHERIVQAAAPVAVTPAAAIELLAESAHRDVVVAIAPYRLAPKTSPPSA